MRHAYLWSWLMKACIYYSGKVKFHMTTKYEGYLSESVHNDNLLEIIIFGNVY